MSILLILPENTVKVEAKLGKIITSSDVVNVMNVYMQSHKKWDGLGQCYGFAKYVFKQLFGVKVTFGYNSGAGSKYLYVVGTVKNYNDVYKLLNQALPGDILAYGQTKGNPPHSMVVVNKSKNKINVLDAYGTKNNSIQLSNYSDSGLKSRLKSGKTKRITLFRYKPKSVDIAEPSLHMPVGSSKQIRITDIGSGNGNYPKPLYFPYSSFVEVSESGLIKAKKTGTTFVSTKVGKKDITTKVIVTSGEKVQSIKLVANPNTIEVNQSKYVDVEYTPKNSYEEITWSSTKTNVATVDKDGKVTAKSIGSTTITGKSKSGLTSSITINVIPETKPENL